MGAERKHRITVLNVSVIVITVINVSVIVITVLNVSMIVVTLFEGLAVILHFEKEKEEEEKPLHMTSWYI